MQQLEEDGFHLDELFKDTVYEEDERQMVLKAVRIIKPNFQPLSLPHSEICSSPLLRDFYSKVKGGCWAHVTWDPAGLMTVSLLGIGYLGHGALVIGVIVTELVARTTSPLSEPAV